MIRPTEEILDVPYPLQEDGERRIKNRVRRGIAARAVGTLITFLSFGGLAYEAPKDVALAAPSVPVAFIGFRYRKNTPNACRGIINQHWAQLEMASGADIADEPKGSPFTRPLSSKANQNTTLTRLEDVQAYESIIDGEGAERGMFALSQAGATASSILLGSLLHRAPEHATGADILLISALAAAASLPDILDHTTNRQAAPYMRQIDNMHAAYDQALTSN